MTRLQSAVPALGLALIVFISGCATVAAPQVRRGDDPLAGREPARSEEVNTGPTAGGRPAPSSGARITPGTGMVINQRAASAPAPSLDSTGEATFNFEGESVHAVVKAILGDLLQQNYVIAPNVQGQVTLATPRPVNAAQALSLLEMVLGWNNARLVWSDGRYNVLPTDQAIAGNLSPRTGSAANARGYEVRAVPLKYISAEEMKKVLEPYARPNAVVSVDSSRNLIVLAGTRSELQNYLRTVEIFDVDWLAGMSVGVFPLQSAQASKIVDELNGVFGEGGKTPVSGMFRFMPLEGQNAVLVITPQARYLREAQTWIERLDAGGGEGSRLYTYEVLYMKATDLADQLGQVFGSGGGGSSSRAEDNASPSVMPGLEPVQIRSTDTPAPDAAGAKGREAAAQAANNASSGNSAGGGDGIALGNDDDVSISAVEASNALLVRASPAQWESIRRAIERLDTMPLQVHIEAQVVEVQLTGELSYGVSWFFENSVVDDADLPSAQGRTIWGDIAGTIGGDGIGWTFLGKNAAAVITALDDISDVRLLSTPSVVVRNNAEAKLDVGTKIPVNSTSFNPITGDNPGSGNGTYTQTQYLDTGVILTVTPRISRDGTVFMEIEQEVSSPGPPRANDPSGNVPINKRSLITEAAIKSGETVMLAGLITEGSTVGSSGVPGLSRLPIVGGLFGTKSRTSDRSEVIILVTPRVIRDPAEARKLTDEYGERFRALDPIRAEPAPRR